ncbi:MAG: peroxiredoxin [Dehalococcoidia bacterium]
MPDAIEVGDPAPDFTLPSTEGDVSLSALLGCGDRVVLAFYVEDGTPSCQTEVSLLKDSYELLREFGASVVAASADSLKSHRAFAERLNGVPFPLASDQDLIAARAYGVVDEGDPRRSRRAAFVIDRDGRVLLALSPFQPSNLASAEAIFQALGMET